MFSRSLLRRALPSMGSDFGRGSSMESLADRVAKGQAKGDIFTRAVYTSVGLPEDGPKPGSEEAKALVEAQEFIASLHEEVAEYDRQNAEAVNAYLSKWSWFRKWTPQVEDTTSSSENAPPAEPINVTEETITSGLNAGATLTRSQPSSTNAQPNSSTAQRRQQNAANNKSALLFRRKNLQQEPLILRKWVPYLCVAVIAFIWTPDTWKLRALYRADYFYAMFRRFIHTQYWRITMDPEEFAAVMNDIEANVPRSKWSVDPEKCPL